MLEDIRHEFEKLVALYESERQLRMQLEAQVAESREENENLRKRIIDLERQVDNHKLSDAFAVSSGDNFEAKKKVDRLIKEIDRCISLLDK